MFRVNTRMSWAFRSILALAILASWTSGITFFIFNKWVNIEGEFGIEKHPFQFQLLKFHGGAAFFMMITYGYLLASHAPAGLQSKRERGLGISLLSVQALLIISAYYLYYGADADRRILVAWTHFSLGVAFPFIVILHIFIGRINLSKRRKNRVNKQ